MFWQNTQRVFALFLAAFLTTTHAHSEAGAALGGAAAIIGAASPMVTAGIQAGADVAINSMQIDAQKYQVDRNADASEYMMGLQSQTAIQMAGLQSQMNAYNQQQSTLRLQMQLDSVARASAMTQQANLQSLMQEYGLKNRELDLQEKAMDQQYSLAKAQASQSGFSQVLDSGANIPVRRYGIATFDSNAMTPQTRLLTSLSSVPSVRNLPSTTSGRTPTSQSLVAGSNRAFQHVVARSFAPARSVFAGRALAGTRGMGPRHFSGDRPAVHSGSTHGPGLTP